MEPEMARLLAELDPAIYMLANQENIKPEVVFTRATEYIAILRQTHPETPIVLIESVRYGHAFCIRKPNNYIIEQRRELQRALQTLQMNGVLKICIMCMAMPCSATMAKQRWMECTLPTSAFCGKQIIRTLAQTTVREPSLRRKPAIFKATFSSGCAQTPAHPARPDDPRNQPGGTHCVDSIL